MKKKFFYVALLLLVVSQCLALQTVEFVQQDIEEIVYAVSLAENIPIICDSTVSGKATFRFFAPDFASSFDVFLDANRLYVDKQSDVWVVSRSKIEEIGMDEDGEKFFNIDANEISCTMLFEQFSKKTDFIIVHEVLPTMPISFHAKNVKLVEAVALIMKNFSGFSVSIDGKSIFVEKEIVQQKSTQITGLFEVQQTEEGFFCGKADNSSFNDALLSLLEYKKLQYCSLVKNSENIEKLQFEDKTFDELLNLICGACSVDYKIQDDFYIFYSSKQKNEQLQQKQTWATYELKYLSFNDFNSVLSFRFPKIKFQSISAYNFTCLATAEEQSEINTFLTECDKPTESFVLNFQYIKAKDFLQNIPTGFSSSDFCATGNQESLFYFGSKSLFEKLQTFVATMDKPVPNIAYDLLIIQTQKSESSNWDLSLKASTLAPNKNYNIGATALPTLAFNVDLVTAFGYNFAAALQASVQSNKTEIFADTTLHGISGVPINFKNTNTFRYRDPYINTETGEKLQSGVTREIISGLVLDVTGYVSGDGMITTNVMASVSRRGADVSSANGNPPPTSEKVVTTQVTGRSGEVIVLSGLLQNDSSFIAEGIPWLSKIPFIGKLFRSDSENKENTEMFIYLVPHILESVPPSTEVSE